MQHTICLMAILLLIPYSNNQNTMRNSTECHEMYLNKGTDVECIDKTTCCLLVYEFKLSEKTICILKQNQTDNYCSNFKDTIGLYGGALIECDCHSPHLSGLKLIASLIALTILLIA